MKFKFFILIALALLTLILSLIPNPPEVLKGFNAMDKIEHYMAYTALSMLTFICIDHLFRKLWIISILSIFLVTVYGGIIELLQQFTGRMPDLYDFAANALGAVSGVVFCTLYIALKHLSKKNMK